MNKKILLIILCAVLGGAILGGMGMLLYKENKMIEQNAKGSAGTTASGDGTNLSDGETFDFEEAGYIKLGKYKGLTADVQPEEEDVYSEMITVAEDTKVKNDTKVQDGDLVNIDFTAKQNGKKLEEASGEDTYVWVGKGEYINDFENGIIGIENGKKKTIDCTFPKDYDDEELAGKTIQFTIKVNGRFGAATAQKASDGACKTVQEYYEYEKEQQLKENQESKGELVWDTLKEECDVESVPEDMLAAAQEDVTMMYTNFAELSGMTLNELLESFGMDENGVDEIAQDTVIDYMISKTIAAKEGLTLDNDYYLQAMREALGYQEGEDGSALEEMEKEYKESQGSHPKDDMLIERVKDFVGEHAKEAAE